MSDSQLHKLKSAKIIGTEVSLTLISNNIGDSNNESNFPRKLLLTDIQVSRLCKSSVNNLSANIKSSKS